MRSPKPSLPAGSADGSCVGSLAGRSWLDHKNQTLSAVVFLDRPSAVDWPTRCAGQNVSDEHAVYPSGDCALHAPTGLVLTPRAGDEALGEDEVCYRGFELALGPRRGRASEDDPRLAVASDGTTKDYLARPKANGYASLHADLLAKACPAAQRAGAWRAGAPDVPVELQIRSARMDAVAERGAANHATYKAAQRRRLAEAGWARYDDIALAAV